MGAWGSGAFHNDSALDFVQGLGRVDPVDRADVILRTLRKASGGPLDVDDASSVVAAAQLVALLHREADFATLDQRLVDLSAATVGSTDVAHLTGDVASRTSRTRTARPPGSRFGTASHCSSEVRPFSIVSWTVPHRRGPRPCTAESIGA